MSAPHRARSAPSSAHAKQDRRTQGVELDDDGSGPNTRLALRPVSLTAWMAKHDNGWRTVVCEQPDRTFAVLVASPGARNIEPDATALTDGAAKDTAEIILRARAGHERCTPECQWWQLEKHLVMLPAEDVDQFESDSPPSSPPR